MLTGIWISIGGWVSNRLYVNWNQNNDHLTEIKFNKVGPWFQ